MSRFSFINKFPQYLCIMRNYTFILSACMLVLIACTKTETPPEPVPAPPVPENSKVVGNWRVVSVAASNYQSESRTSLTGTDSTREVKVYDYVSFESLGDITITDSTLTITKLTYKYRNNYQSYTYLNGVYQGMSVANNETYVFEHSYQFPYKMINADSMYLENGTMTYVGGGQVMSPAKGAKISIVADTLYMTTKEEANSTYATNDYKSVKWYALSLQTIKYVKKPA